jgi:hypothetical protein
MQDVNDDMDELLRRAASGYPLNTSTANWNKVKTLLAENTEANTSEVPDAVIQQKKYPNILLLLLLLAIPLLCVDYALQSDRHAMLSSSKTNPSTVYDNPLHNSADAATRGIKKRALIESKKENNFSREITNSKKQPADTKSFRKNFPGLIDDNKLTSKKNLPSESMAGITRRDKNNFKSAETGDVTIDTLKSNDKNIYKKTPDTDTSKAGTISREAVLNKKKNNHAFYAGVLAGPDISTVKLQAVNKTGFSVGFVAGYALGKKLFVETGLLWDKKFYYTDGKYFKPKNISIPSYITIDDVDGNCNMIEWPVSLSYKIRSFSKSYLAANAGFSSYCMKSEKYSYTYQRNGVENEWDLAYKNSSTSIFSVVNAGVSYNHNISNSYFLRIQPYAKIPVYSFGVGRLPITSAGIYFGLVKRIL